MTLTPRQRWLILGGTLAVTLALVAWLGKEPEEPAGTTEARPSASARSATGTTRSGAEKPVPPTEAGNSRLSRSEPAAEKREIRDIFPQQTWQPPPPPAASQPAGPPQPPALPFTYLGKLIDDGRVTIYLGQGQERNLAVRQGDVINGTYRVKRISPAAVTFVYIPMNKQQVLKIGSTK